MTDSHRFSVSVAGAVIREDGKVLAIKRRDNGHWEPPGGVVEAGETLQGALVREIAEETGIHVRLQRLSGVYQNSERDILSLVFVCTLDEGEPEISDESSRVEWLDRSQIEQLMDEAYAVRLLDSLGEWRDVAVRTHDGVKLD